MTTVLKGFIKSCGITLVMECFLNKAANLQPEIFSLKQIRHALNFSKWLLSKKHWDDLFITLVIQKFYLGCCKPSFWKVMSKMPFKHFWLNDSFLLKQIRIWNLRRYTRNAEVSSVLYCTIYTVSYIALLGTQADVTFNFLLNLCR